MKHAYIRLQGVPINEDYRDWIGLSGITYSRWEPQPIADQIKLHNVQNLPDVLPDWFDVVEVGP
jgi:hypothetical protein